MQQSQRTQFQGQLRCRNLDVKPEWLHDEPEELYTAYLNDAFELQILKEEKEAKAKESQVIEEDAEQFDYSRVIDDLENGQAQPHPIEAPIDLLKQLTISMKDREKEITIYKRGGILNGIEKRPAKYNQNQVVQLKKKGSPEVAKVLGKPNLVVLETAKKFNPMLPWQGGPNEECRLMLYIPGKPIATYVQTVELGRKYQVYLRIESMMAEFEPLHDIMEHLKAQYDDAVMYSATINFNIWIQQIAHQISEERKKLAKLSDPQKGLLAIIDPTVLQKVLETWNRKSNEIKFAQMEELEREQEIERRKQEEINKKREMEEQQRKKEQELAQKRQQEEIRIQQKPVLREPNYDLLKRSLTLNINSSGQLVDSFLQRWAKRSEFAAEAERMNGLSFVVNIRNLMIYDTIPISRLTLEVLFQGRRNEHTSDMMSEKVINQKDYKVNPDSTPFFKLKMQGQLKDKSRYEYFGWELKENAFENYANASRTKQDMEGCQVSFSNFAHEDLLCFELYDALSLAEVAKSDIIRLSLADLIKYCKTGRSIWIPLQYKRELPKKPHDEETEPDPYLINQFVVPVQVDIQFSTQALSQSLSYDDELTKIVESNLPILDPIYTANYMPPYLNKNTIKILLKILEENNPYLKSNVKLIMFMMYLGTLDTGSVTDIPSTDSVYQDIKKFTIRKIIENAFHLFTRLPAQEAIWNQLQWASQPQSQDKAVYRNPIPQFQQSYKNPTNYPLLDPLIKKICIEGLAPHIRPAFWFTLMDGLSIYTLVKDIMKRRFFIFPEQRSSLPEQTWLYQQLNIQKQNLRLNIFKDIEKFIKVQDEKNGLPCKLIEAQFRNVMQTYLVFGACNGWQININYLPYLFLIGLRLVSLANYQYIQFKKRLPLIEDDETLKLDSGYTTFMSDEDCVLENEAVAFWLLCGFVKSVLETYPVYNSNKKVQILSYLEVLMDDCSFVTVYLTKYQPKMVEMIKNHDLRIESFIYDLLLQVFADVFASEILFCTWDIIVYHTIKAQHATVENQKRSYIIPTILVILFERLAPKMHNVQTIEELLSAIQLEGNLLSDNAAFRSTLDETLDKMKQLIENTNLSPMPDDKSDKSGGKAISAMKPDDRSVFVS